MPLPYRRRRGKGFFLPRSIKVSYPRIAASRACALRIFFARKNRHTRHKCCINLYINMLRVYSLPSQPYTNEGLTRH